MWSLLDYLPTIWMSCRSWHQLQWILLWQWRSRKLSLFFCSLLRYMLDRGLWRIQEIILYPPLSVLLNWKKRHTLGYSCAQISIIMLPNCQFKCWSSSLVHNIFNIEDFVLTKCYLPKLLTWPGPGFRHSLRFVRGWRENIYSNPGMSLQRAHWKCMNGRSRWENPVDSTPTHIFWVLISSINLSE